MGAMDTGESSLLDGYFRENKPNRLLPREINRIITAYYLRMYSVRGLQKWLNPFLVRRRKHVKFKRERVLEQCCIIMKVVMFWSMTTAKDIAMLVITVRNECTLRTVDADSGYICFRLRAWEICAAVIHIYVMCCLYFMRMCLVVSLTL